MPEVADYVISARIIAKDASDPGAKSAEKRLRQVEERGLAVGARLQQIFARVGAVLGGGMLVRGVVNLNAQMQSLELGMAGLFSANTGMQMVDSLRLAQSEIGRLREMAAVGAGELGDYTGGFQLMFQPLHQAGADLGRIRGLLGQTVAVGFATGRGQEGARLLAADILQAFTGGAGQRITPQLNMILQSIGMTADGFNKLGDAAKLAKLEEAFAKWQPAVDAMGNTWDARMGTMREHVKSLAREVTKPLFDTWSDQLAGANYWIKRNRDGLAEITTVWGERLVKLWDHLVAQAGTYAALVAAAAAVQVGPGMARGVAGSAGGVAVANAFQNARFMSAAAGGGAGGLMAGAGGFLRALGPILGRLTAPLGIVTSLFMGIKGALSEFPGFVGYVMDAWGRLRYAFGQLGESFGMLSGKGSSLNVVGGFLVGTLGFVVDVFGVLARGAASLVAAFGMLNFLFRDIAEALLALGRGNVSGAMAALNRDRGAELTERLAAIWSEGWIPKQLQAEQRHPMEKPTGWLPDVGIPELPPGTRGGNTYIGTVNVKVKSEVNADPARVARAFDEVFDKLARNRLQAGRIPVGAR